VQPSVCGCLRGMTRRGGAIKGAGTVTSANVPLGSIAMPIQRPKWALVPTPSGEPAVLLPASVVTFLVARSTRRTRPP